MVNTANRATKCDEGVANRLARPVRHAEMGQHHRISGKYLCASGGEMAWREDNRRQSNKNALHMMASGAALAHSTSRV
jgi:hypothetical protein